MYPTRRNGSLMAKERNGANFGSVVLPDVPADEEAHVSEDEAWLREISSSEAAGDHTIEREID
jgi:hypothetical protein